MYTSPQSIYIYIYSALYICPLQSIYIYIYSSLIGEKQTLRVPAQIDSKALDPNQLVDTLQTRSQTLKAEIDAQKEEIKQLEVSELSVGIDPGSI